MEAIYQTGSVIWVSIVEVLVDASFYLLLGLVLAGVLKTFIPKDFIAKHVGPSTTRSIVKASIIGVPMPLCSCSVVPMAVSMREQGASKGATTSFLISAPETGVDSIAVSYAMLDPLMTIFRPLAAFITAFFAGIFENHAGDRQPENRVTTTSDHCSCADDNIKQSVRLLPWYVKLRDGMRYAFGALLQDIAYYLLIGLMISALIAALVPPDFFTDNRFSTLTMMLIMLVIGIPVYVCASASTPIAAALVLKGLSPGAALVFLLAGPATNLSSVGIVKNLMGTRSLWIYLGTIGLTAVLLGLVLDAIYHLSGIPIVMNLGSASEIIPEPVKIASAVVFLPMLLWGFIKELRHKLGSGK